MECERVAGRACRFVGETSDHGAAVPVSPVSVRLLASVYPWVFSAVLLGWDSGSSIGVVGVLASCPILALPLEFLPAF